MLHCICHWGLCPTRDRTLDLIPDCYNCPSGFNSSLPEGRAQHRRKAVYKTKLPLQPTAQQQVLTGIAHAAVDLLSVAFVITLKNLLVTGSMLLASRHFKAAVSMAVHVEHKFWPS